MSSLYYFYFIVLFSRSGFFYVIIQKFNITIPVREYVKLVLI